MQVPSYPVRLSRTLALFLGLMTSPFALAEVVEITFETAQNPEAVRGAEATNLYTGLGVRFPSRPEIRVVEGGTPGLSLVQGQSSGGPDPLPTRVQCEALRIEFEETMDVRTVRLRSVNRHLRHYSIVASSETGEIVDEFTFWPRRGPPWGPLELYRDVELSAEIGAPGITRILVDPPAECFDLAAIDDLRFETANPVVAIDTVPDPVWAYRASELRPNISWSGRINDVAIDPRSRNRVLATTESGGLWRSDDRGGRWRPVRSLPVFSTNAVHRVRANPDIILVTANQDFQRFALGGGTLVTSGGGVWLSLDGGANWTQPPQAVPSFAGRTPPRDDQTCPAISDAYGISEDPETGRIFIGTSCGVTYVDGIQTASPTWRHAFLPLRNRAYVNRRLVTVAALVGPAVIAGGGEGAWRSEDNGATWVRSSTAVGNSTDFHGAAPIPGLADAGLLISGGIPRQLWATFDGGDNWTPIVNPPANGEGCGGIAHLRALATPDTTASSRKLYYGNTCVTSSTTLTFNAARATARAGGWSTLPASHPDTRALGFENGAEEPRYLGSDGGLDILNDEGGYQPVGSGPDGINALQVYGVSGQHVSDEGGYRLAFGTQDNGHWSSTDETNWPASQSTGPEGDAFSMSTHTLSGETDRWTYYTCGGCGVRISDPLFQNQQNWPGYATLGAGWSFGAPVRLSESLLPGAYVQIAAPDEERRDAGEKLTIALTGDYGASFYDLAYPTERLRGSPRVSQLLTVFQAFASGNYSEFNQGLTRTFGSTRLRTWQVSLFGPTRANDPAMNGMGSLGHYAFQFQWVPVFAVNPADRDHLLAPDVQNREMMVSRDAGENWAAMPGLKNQLTRGGALDMALPIPWGSLSRPLVSAISFYPDNPDLILIGLHQGGAWITENGGARWTHVEGSGQIPNIIGFEWKDANEIFVASYGRGVWKIQNTFRRHSMLGLGRWIEGLEPDLPVLRNVLPGTMTWRPRLEPRASTRRMAAEAVPLLKALKSEDLDAVALVVDGFVTGLTPGGATDLIGDRLQVSQGASILSFANSDDALRLKGSKGGKGKGKPGFVPEAKASGLELPDKLHGAERKVRKGLESGYLLTDTARQEVPESMIQASLLEAVETENTRRKASLEKRESGPIGVGIKDREVVGVIMGHRLRPIPAVEPIVPPKPGPASTSTPPKGPRLVVHSNVEGVYFGDGTLDGRRDVTLEGEGFPTGRVLLISVDSNPVAQLTANDNGYFRETVALKGLATGPHTLSITSKDGQVLAEEGIFLRHFDEKIPER